MVSAVAGTGSAASVSNQRVTRSAPPASGCVTPDAADSFLTSDQWIYLWFTAAVNADDQLSRLNRLPTEANSRTSQPIIVTFVPSVNMPAREASNWDTTVIMDSNAIHGSDVKYHS